LPAALSPTDEPLLAAQRVVGVDVLMQGTLLKRRNNTHNKWQVSATISVGFQSILLICVNFVNFKFQ
jgi:hypothetical protein